MDPCGYVTNMVKGTEVANQLMARKAPWPTQVGLAAHRSCLPALRWDQDAPGHEGAMRQAALEPGTARPALPGPPEGDPVQTLASQTAR